jgi:hypothetical protein
VSRRRQGSDGPALEYEVGYGRPPQTHRFQPGRSGNPKGRPKGVRRLPDILSQLLNQRITVQDRGRPRTMTMQEVILRNLVDGAARRDPKALQALLTVMQRFPLNEDEGSPRMADLSAEDAAIFEAFLETHGAKDARDDGIETRTGPAVPLADKEPGA